MERWSRAKRWILYGEQLDVDEATSHAVAPGAGRTLCARRLDFSSWSMWFHDGNAYGPNDVSCLRCRARLAKLVAN